MDGIENDRDRIAVGNDGAVRWRARSELQVHERLEDEVERRSVGDLWCATNEERDGIG